MNRTPETKSAEIEARLHRSLTSQVRAPRLDGRFDAGVWARIEAERHAAAQRAPRTSAAASWLRASNTAGMIVAGLLVAYFGLRMLSGVDVEVSVPHLSVELSQATQQFVGYGIAATALIFGLMLTPMGRSVRGMFL